MSQRTSISPCPVSSDLADTDYCVASIFRRTTRALTKAYDAALQPSRLRSTQFVILVAVAKTQPVSVGDLAGILSVDASTLSRSLRLMHRQRLVKVSGRSAMRQRFVTLSPRGAHKLDDSVLLWRQLQTQLVAFLGSDHWKKLQRDLETLSRHAVGLQ